MLSAIEEEQLANIRLHADDARPLLRWLPEASIGRAFILFPDPWPKKRHHKRRLVSAATLAELARVMRPGAELRIATDIGDYARWMLLADARAAAVSLDAPTGPRDWRAAAARLARHPLRAKGPSRRAAAATISASSRAVNRGPLRQSFCTSRLQSAQNSA